MNSLEEIAQLVYRCTNCDLHLGRTNAVPGEGSPNAKVMFIGEGPGVQEDRQGRPFVGPAGQFLDELLASIGMNRGQVYIANMVNCRPPQNRDPLPAEIGACGAYLDRQIELLDPSLIVTLGRFSLGRFFPGESISRARGRVREKDGRRIYPIMHPAAALYRREMRDSIMEDFRRIPEILAQGRQQNPEAEISQEEQTPPPEQLSLF
ncbi:MAG: uracil-DNA glycosylase [Chloroflexota bacterium]|nr:uracil-DNA glycosylase [Chloroflexota bacterium]